MKTAGNTRVVQFTAGNNKTCTVRNLSKDTYLDTRTGEVKQKKKSESRYQSPKSVRKSINRLMDLIRCNATNPAKCKWLTVTYKDVMTDGKQAFQDAKQFLRKQVTSDGEKTAMSNHYTYDKDGRTLSITDGEGSATKYQTGTVTNDKSVIY